MAAMNGLIVRIAAIAAAVLAAIAFLSAEIAGFTAPAWVLPAALLIVAVLVALRE